MQCESGHYQSYSVIHRFSDNGWNDVRVTLTYMYTDTLTRGGGEVVWYWTAHVLSDLCGYSDKRG